MAHVSAFTWMRRSVTTGARSSSNALRFNLSLALLIWAAWIGLTGRFGLERLIADWRVAVTMVFGSLVGGGTSEGGGAVAFPIFTKLLHVAPRDARNFALAIQSVGMGAATVSIFYLRIAMERRALLYAGLPGILGVILGALFVAPLIPPVFVRTSFTVLVSSLGAALLLLNRKKAVRRNQAIPIFGATEKSVLVAAGFVGGVVSALVGTGVNSVVFMVLVLLFRVDEKIVTPTTVVLMTMVTIPGFLLHVFFIKDVSPTVMGYWIAAIPVVAVGAPIGALIASNMERHAIVRLLLVLIALEFCSTLVLVPLSPVVLRVSSGVLLLCGSVDLAMSRSRRYAPRASSPHKPAELATS